GYRTGHFPDGSTIVFDVQQIITDKADIKSGTRKFIDVMYKDSAQFRETGGWGFDEFMGDSQIEGRLTIKQQQNCFNCHASKKEHGYVFTEFKD
ncbi:MAG: cytochrome P460 family protein, partial [Chitinophagaceae bacterium]